MNCLVVGFYGEGRAEYGFLAPIVERTLQEMVPHIDILVYELTYETIDGSGAGQLEKILRVAEETSGYGLVVFHLDADAPSTENAYRERFEPGYRAVLESEHAANTDIVPIIPVRMTEAWMLVDFQAFRGTVGTRLSAEELGFEQRAEQVERIQNPKAVFEHAVRRSRPRRRIPLHEIYEPLARRTNLERLLGVPAYQEFVNRLSEKLRELPFIDF